MKTITYAIDHTGLVISRVGSEVAFPVLEYDNMTPANNFRMNYHLEKAHVFSLAGNYWSLLT